MICISETSRVCHENAGYKALCWVYKDKDRNVNSSSLIIFTCNKFWVFLLLLQKRHNKVVIFFPTQIEIRVGPPENRLLEAHDWCRAIWGLWARCRTPPGLTRGDGGITETPLETLVPLGKLQSRQDRTMIWFPNCFPSRMPQTSLENPLHHHSRVIEEQ